MEKSWHTAIQNKTNARNDISACVPNSRLVQITQQYKEKLPAQMVGEGKINNLKQCFLM